MVESSADIIIEGLDKKDIYSILNIYNDAVNIKKSIDAHVEELEKLLISELEKRKWKNIKDEKTDVSVTLVKKEKTKVMTKLLKMLLNETQLNQVIVKTPCKGLTLVNTQIRKELNKHVKK